MNIYLTLWPCQTKHQRQVLIVYENINDLVNLAIRAKKAYYQTGSSIMSDLEYDNLELRIRQIDPNHPFLNNVGTTPVGKTIKHNSPMLSLDNVFTEQELREWLADKECQIVVENKYDGLAFSLCYVFGHLATAASRGDGVDGELLTDNFLHYVGSG